MTGTYLCAIMYSDQREGGEPVDDYLDNMIKVLTIIALILQIARQLFGKDEK